MDTVIPRCQQHMADRHHTADTCLQVAGHDHEEANAVCLDERPHGVCVLQLAFRRDDNAAAHAERPPQAESAVHSASAKSAMNMYQHTRHVTPHALHASSLCMQSTLTCR